MTDKKTIDIVLGDYPHTIPIKTASVDSPTLDLRFTDFKPTHNAFKGMIRELKYDVCEMAIVTYALAKAYGKPIHLLPAVMIGRFQQPYAICRSDLSLAGPGDLAGRRVGVRSYTTTTVSWLRGILANDYGADLDAVEWTSFEDPHVAEYQDRTRRAPAGKSIIQMLLGGELDVVLGDATDDPRTKTLFPDVKKASEDWYARHRLVPVNHLVVVTEALLESAPAAVAEVYRLLKQGKVEAGASADGIDYTPFGIEAVRPSLELILDYAAQQQVLPRRLTVDELFDDRLRKAIGE